MKRLYYVGPGRPELPEGMPRPDDWSAGIEFEADLAARILARHGPQGSRQWSERKATVLSLPSSGGGE